MDPLSLSSQQNEIDTVMQILKEARAEENNGMAIASAVRGAEKTKDATASMGETIAVRKESLTVLFPLFSNAAPA